MLNSFFQLLSLNKCPILPSSTVPFYIDSKPEMHKKFSDYTVSSEKIEVATADADLLALGFKHSLNYVW